MTNILGGSRDLPGEVVNLSAIGRGPSRSRSTRKNKGSPDAVIFDICEISEAAELRNRRRPEIVGTLDDFRNIRRDFIVVLLGQRQQIGADGLVD